MSVNILHFLMSLPITIFAFFTNSRNIFLSVTFSVAAAPFASENVYIAPFDITNTTFAANVTPATAFAFNINGCIYANAIGAYTGVPNSFESDTIFCKFLLFSF
jgi:hypothetical protein